MLHNTYILLTLVQLVFFAAVSFLYFTAKPYPVRDWARITVAVSAGILALVCLFSLF